MGYCIETAVATINKKIKITVAALKENYVTFLPQSNSFRII